MRVKYLGEYSREARSYGCSRCGTGTSVNGQQVYKTTDRMYYAGRLYQFEQQKEVEVDEMLGRYLLNRRYINPDGVTLPSYEEVIPVVDTTTQPNATSEGMIPPEKAPDASAVTPPVSVPNTPTNP